MNRRTIIVLIIALLCINIATGIGISPSRITAEHMTRGTHFEKMIHLSGINPGESVQIVAEGEIADWIGIDRGKEFVFPDQVSVPIIINIDVPVDIENRHYAGSVTISSVPQKMSGGGNSASVIPGVRVKIEVDVTGEQIKDDRVLFAKIEKGEADDPLPIQLDIENIGNVIGRPSMLSLTIFNKFKTVKLLSLNITSIEGAQPHTRQLSTVLANHELPPGQYWAMISVYDESDVIYSDEIVFELIEPDSFKKSGVFKILEIPRTVITGDTIKLTAWFENTGETALDAKLVGEVYMDDHLITVAESEPITVMPSQIEPLVSYHTPGSPGEYSVIGYVSYEGGQSKIRETSFIANPTEGNRARNYRVVVILGVMLSIIVLIVLAKLKRSK